MFCGSKTAGTEAGSGSGSVATAEAGALVDEGAPGGRFLNHHFGVRNASMPPLVRCAWITSNNATECLPLAILDLTLRKSTVRRAILRTASAAHACSHILSIPSCIEIT